METVVCSEESIFGKFLCACCLDRDGSNLHRLRGFGVGGVSLDPADKMGKNSLR